MKHEIEASLTKVEIAADHRSGTGWFSFAANLPVFAGHFPGDPIVPGIFLIEMARTVAERVTGSALELVEVQDARFTARIGPQQSVTAAVKLSSTDDLWRCETAITTAAGMAAGRLRLVLRPEQRQHGFVPDPLSR